MQSTQVVKRCRGIRLQHSDIAGVHCNSRMANSAAFRLRRSCGSLFSGARPRGMRATVPLGVRASSVVAPAEKSTPSATAATHSRSHSKSAMRRNALKPTARGVRAAVRSGTVRAIM